jgi:DNA-binding LacI/PurR family transcriptional regulator
LSSTRAKIRLSDVAAAAGVSAATVSRALQGHPDIRPETQERIRAMAERLGYQPSAVARALRTGRHSTISAVMPPDLGNWWQPMLHATAVAAERLGYRLLIQPLPQQASVLSEALEQALDSLPVDGAIIFPQFAESGGRPAGGWTGLPVVAFDDVDAEPVWPAVRSDNEQGGYLAARHLLELGRSRLIVVAPATPAAYVDQRLEGFRRALAEFGHDPAEARVVRTGESYDQIARDSAAVDGLLADGVRFDGMFALLDRLGFMALRSLTRAGVAVPEEVAVVGFDDEYVAQLSTPMLSSIRQPFPELGNRLVKMLLEYLQDPALAPRIEELPVELVVRESSMPTVSARRTV